MRLIDADALIEDIKNCLWDWSSVDGITATTVLKQTIEDIQNQPTVDAAPVVHGRWTYFNGIGKGNCQCSECSHWVGVVTAMNYCPHCGAKMDGGDHA